MGWGCPAFFGGPLLVLARFGFLGCCFFLVFCCFLVLFPLSPCVPGSGRTPASVWSFGRPARAAPSGTLRVGGVRKGRPGRAPPRSRGGAFPLAPPGTRSCRDRFLAREVSELRSCPHYTAALAGARVSTKEGEHGQLRTRTSSDQCSGSPPSSCDLLE